MRVARTLLPGRCITHGLVFMQLSLGGIGFPSQGEKSARHVHITARMPEKTTHARCLSGTVAPASMRCATRQDHHQSIAACAEF